MVTLTYLDGQVSGVSLKANATAAAVNVVTGVQWEPFGAVKSWQWQQGATTQLNERVRDSYGRLVRYRLGSTIRDLTYDAADRITRYTHYDAVTAAAIPAQDQVFTYDELGRLTGVSFGTSSWTLGYDANGNRTSVTLNGTASSYTTPTTSNRLTSTTNPSRGFTYDAAGNTLTRTTTGAYTATYALENRLTTMRVGTPTTTYSYDAMGQRTRKHTASAASTTIFAYDQEGQLLGEYSSTGAALREFIWFNGEPIAIFTPNGTSAPNVFNIHSDHLATPRVIVNQANQSRWSWIAEPFGTTAANTNPASLGAFTFNLRFPGQYADAESGLFYNYFRDLDPATSRYTQSDPIGLMGGINTYSYVENQPTMLVDPSGLQAVWPRGLPVPAGPAPGSSTGGRGGYDPRTDTYSPPGPGFLFPDWLTNLTNDSSRNLPFPDIRRGMWTCTCRADCNDNIPGNCPVDPSKRFAFGTATSPNFGVAVKEGKRAATQLLACQPKHVPCICTGPNGERRRAQ